MDEDSDIDLINQRDECRWTWSDTHFRYVCFFKSHFHLLFFSASHHLLSATIPIMYARRNHVALCYQRILKLTIVARHMCTRTNYDKAQKALEADSGAAEAATVVRLLEDQQARGLLLKCQCHQYARFYRTRAENMCTCKQGGSRPDEWKRNISFTTIIKEQRSLVFCMTGKAHVDALVTKGQKILGKLHALSEPCMCRAPHSAAPEPTMQDEKKSLSYVHRWKECMWR